jgi:hypothetical protein
MAAQLVYHSDEATLDDHLGHAGRVAQVADRIRSCTPPLVVAIHGDWGSGKTSFLRKLRLYLGGGNGDGNANEIGKRLWQNTYNGKGHGFETIWFEAWRYQFESNPAVALLNEIRTHFTWSKKLVGEAAKLSFAALMSIEEVGKQIGIHPGRIVEGGEKWERDTLAQPLPTQLCRDLLEQAIKTLLGRGDKKLVVFIDDLDRCQGPVALRLLEAMKIYLSLPNCVFVLGLDWRHVREAVEAELKKSGMASDGNAAEDYLGKLCQAVYAIPLLTDAQPYLGQLCDAGCFPKEDGEGGEGGVWLPLLRQHKLLPANPRKIKYFVNALASYVQQLKSTLPPNTKPDHHLALIAVYLNLFANDVFRVLENDVGFWSELVDFCRYAQSKHEVLKRYVTSERAIQETEESQKSVDRPKVLELKPAFRDPAEPRLFRAARLIREWQGGKPPTTDEFNRYFRLSEG